MLRTDLPSNSSSRRSEPRNYGLMDEEKAEEERKAAEERLAREALEEAEREHKEGSGDGREGRFAGGMGACVHVRGVGVRGEGLAKPSGPVALPFLLTENAVEIT